MTPLRERAAWLRWSLVGVIAAAIALTAPGTASALVPPDMLPLPASVAAGRHAVGGQQVHPLPAGSGTGRRVVYSQTEMHVWAVNAKGRVLRDWKVSGRPDWPNTGTYHVFSKSLWSRSSIEDVGFRWMVRFAHGHTTNIGFHNIPYDSAGRPIQSLKKLGHPVHGGGCIRSGDSNAHWLYDWAHLGTTVVVIR